MRIVAGTHGGRRLLAPRGREVRPTSDRVREALFSILGDRVVGASVLDLFAGTGALGLEALSRGAARATFVDRDTSAVQANLAALGLEGEVHRRDALAFLRAGAGPFDLVFLDPPYRDAGSLGPKLADTLPAALARGALVVSESDRREPLDLPGLETLDERRYGDTLIRLHA
jgi:16S rRNA (guanine(966)-N(2))-methyltransferase RsmD